MWILDLVIKVFNAWNIKTWSSSCVKLKDVMGYLIHIQVAGLKKNLKVFIFVDFIMCRMRKYHITTTSTPNSINLRVANKLNHKYRNSKEPTITTSATSVSKRFVWPRSSFILIFFTIFYIWNRISSITTVSPSSCNLQLHSRRFQVMDKVLTTFWASHEIRNIRNSGGLGT